MLEVKSVDLHYGAAQALRNVSLHAQVGEVTCVLGRNGVGKTSLGRSVAQAMGRKFVRVSLGGIRDEASLEAALATGVKRINLGTAALENPEWTARAIAEHGDRVAVGLDVRGTTLAARGWTKEGGDLWEVLARLEDAGCARYVVTDVTKDGTLKGPNTELLAQVCAKTAKPVVASGGISSLEDVAALAAMTGQGVEGAIMGKALYAGRFSLEQALAVAGGATVEQARSEQPGPVAP